MTLAEFAKLGKTSLALLYGDVEADALVKRLLLEREGVSSCDYVLHPDKVLLNESLLIENLERLKSGEPLQYVLGYVEFHGLKMCVNENVLVPRYETEYLVDIIFKHYRNLSLFETHILDICTGSGCILWSLSFLLKNVMAYGCDFSEKALNVAENQWRFIGKENAKKINNPTFFKCDILLDNALQVINEKCCKKFDIIVSNPPYVLNSEKPLMHRNVLEYEPHIALFVDDNNPLVFYERISKIGTSLLKKGGTLWFEINEKFAKETVAIMEKDGYKQCRIINDLNNKERFVCGELCH